MGTVHVDLTIWDQLVDVGKFFVGGAVPVIGIVWFLHQDRVRATGQRFEALHEKVDHLDKDIDGLTKQLAGTIKDVEQRFLTRQEHLSAIDRLDHSVRSLNDSIDTLSGRLFDLARDGARGHGPLP